MKQLLFCLILIFTFIGTAEADTQPALIFSQDVVAIDADGNTLPSVRIEPQTISGMQIYDFDLGRDRLLRIETNIVNAEQRGLIEVAATVRRCYSYIEATTGRQLKHGVLLYLIEQDEIPYAYSFRASYDDPSQWDQVRLALIERGAALSGKGTPFGLSDLLYDTLPHELGHDVLGDIPQLAHDIDGSSSYHTRWLIEGICEVLAKGFSLEQAPALHRRFLALRSVDTVLSEARMLTDMLNWAQQNENGLILESDLYGAAMLTVMAWTRSVDLKGLLDKLASHSGPVDGSDLVAMMLQMTGVDLHELIRRAHAHGHMLSRQVMLVRLD